MPRGVKKAHLPTKICVVCNRPFTWRKKWEKCWDEVLTCSKRCQGERKRDKSKAGKETRRSTVASSAKRLESKAASSSVEAPGAMTQTSASLRELPVLGMGSLSASEVGI